MIRGVIVLLLSAFTSYPHFSDIANYISFNFISLTQGNVIKIAMKCLNLVVDRYYTLTGAPDTPHTSSTSQLTISLLMLSH